MRVEHLQASVPNDSPRAPLYRDSYPSALRMANLESIELVDRFPILTGSFGYTRGKPGAGASRLVPFSIGSDYVVYADIAETEALFVRLQPSRVASWLSSRGFDLGSWHDDPSARVAILRGVDLPSPGDSPNPSSAGSHLLSLLHTYSHRFIRTVSVRAGIDRNALSELLVPLHCGFFVYAASRGDFVLGGLQAIFETELDRVLRELIHGDHRCVLDPGCQRGGGACVACLHLGEPSCRYFNSFLDRSLLFGPTGYLRAPNKTW
jgi:hypothetical protein